MTGVLTLAWIGAAQARVLWVSDSFDGSRSELFELDADTGAVLSSIPGPGPYADALSFANDGQSIFVLDSSPSGSLVSTVWEVDLTGSVLNNFEIETDAEGLTILADGSLVIGGGNGNVVAFVDQSDGSFISSFTPANNVFGLASNGADRLFALGISGVIDTYDFSGNLLGSLNTGIGGTTLGLAYTGDSFFVTSTGSTVWEVDLAGNILNSFNGPGPFTEGADFPFGIQVPVPEPGSLFLLGLGLVGLAYRKRRG